MRTFIKSCFSVVAVSMLFIFAQNVMAESSKEKDKAVDPLRMCYEKCRGEKDKQAYDEACMMKCKETHQGTSPVVPTTKK